MASLAAAASSSSPAPVALAPAAARRPWRLCLGLGGLATFSALGERFQLQLLSRLGRGGGGEGSGGGGAAGVAGQLSSAGAQADASFRAFKRRTQQENWSTADLDLLTAAEASPSTAAALAVAAAQTYLVTAASSVAAANPVALVPNAAPAAALAATATRPAPLAPALGAGRRRAPAPRGQAARAPAGPAASSASGEATVATPEALEARLARAVTLLPKMPMPRKLRFEKCALVGSSSKMTGRGYGGEIDKHDTVIRVNRLPTKRFFKDFGRKTNVYFANPYFLKDKACLRYPVQFLGGGAYNCNLTGTRQCGFDAMMWKGADWPYRHKTWQQQFAPKCQVTCHSFPCAVQTDKLNRAAYQVLNLGSKEPTTGFHAFLTLAPICTSLRLYGFGGGMKTADNHGMLQSHGYAVEWAFWKRISKGLLSLKKAPKLLQRSLAEMVKRGGLSVAEM